MYNFFGAHRHSRWFFVSVANSLNCLKALTDKGGRILNPAAFVIS